MDLAHVAAAFGLGVALGSSPGPVQLLLFSDASRGGVGRGLRTMLGANATFGAMLVLLALGLSRLEPGDAFLRVVQVVGGLFLIWIALDALRARGRPLHAETSGPTRHPAARGAIAVVLNPGVYVFLATTGTAVLGGATDQGGRPLAVLTALALLLGVSLMDGAMVLLGSGAHRLPERFLSALTGVLALVMAAAGAWLVVKGLAG